MQYDKELFGGNGCVPTELCYELSRPQATEDQAAQEEDDDGELGVDGTNHLETKGGWNLEVLPFSGYLLLTQF